MRLLAIGGRHRLPPGQWLIRLRAPFDKGQFVSPASARLRDAARSELEQMFAGVWVK
jgi:ribonuclease P protein component